MFLNIKWKKVSKLVDLSDFIPWIYGISKTVKSIKIKPLIEQTSAIKANNAWNSNLTYCIVA
jgi:hypothetical protein